MMQGRGSDAWVDVTATRSKERGVVAHARVTLRQSGIDGEVTRLSSFEVHKATLAEQMVVVYTPGVTGEP